MKNHENRPTSSGSYNQNNNQKRKNSRASERVQKVSTIEIIQPSVILTKKQTQKKTRQNADADFADLTSGTKQQQRRILNFNETSVLMAFILVIMTLLIITCAMFKLAGSIAALSERLYALENILAHYSKQCHFQPPQPSSI